MKLIPYKRLLAWIMTLCLTVTVFSSGVFAVPLTDPSLAGMTSFVLDKDTLTVTDGTDTNYEVVVYNADDEETQPTAVTNGNSTVYSIPENVSGELSIAIQKAGGSYVFSGEGNGNITVKKGATSAAYLYLNGLTMTSAFTSVITVNKDSTATCSIYAMQNTINTLTDHAYNNSDDYADNLAAESAVIKCKANSNIWLLGNGTLNLMGNAKNGIKANGKLTIAGNLNLNITAADNGISGEDTVTIHSGFLNLTAEGGDGIKCGADDTPTGDITINGGTVIIDAYGDGIQATANLTVNGGVLDITCYDGYATVYNGDDSSYPSAKGLKASGSYTDENGLEADATECMLTINGGYIKVNSADDAIHSDKDVAVTAGVLDLYTGDDGIHSEYDNTIGTSGAPNQNLYITVHKCYEGIEGANITIYSGIINIFATDDSINAANSDLGKNYAFSIDIHDGFIYCASATGDCLDSNRNFTIYDGTLVLLGSITQQDNTAVDTDGSFNIQGGQILTIGNSGMIKNPTTTQNYCTWTSVGSTTASAGGSSGGSTSIRPGRPGRPGQDGSSDGSVVANNQQLTITDANGNSLISVAVQWDMQTNRSASYVLYSDSTLISGNQYTLSVGAIKADDGSSNITTPSVDRQPATPQTDESATPAIPAEVIAAPNTDSENPDDGPDTPAAPLYGDLDENGAITATDALWVLQAVVGKRQLTNAQFINGNVNGDTAIGASDALLILQHVVGKITQFPLEQ